MRTLIIGLTVAMLDLVSVAAVEQATPNLQVRRSFSQWQPELAGFSIAVERASSGIVLTCERGCSWKTLTFGCGENKTCASKITEYGMPKETAGEDF